MSRQNLIDAIQGSGQDLNKYENEIQELLGEYRQLQQVLRAVLAHAECSTTHRNSTYCPIFAEARAILVGKP